MNKKIFGLLTLPALILSLGSCNKGGNAPKPDTDNPDTDNPEIVDPVIEKVDFKKATDELKKGFKATGTVTGVTKYYVDEQHLTPSEMPARTEVYDTSLTYTDTPEYVGTDVKFYQINEDNSKTYIGGDNFFNDEGLVAFNYIGYDNELRNDMYATDENNNAFAFASSGLINPFRLVKAKDFTQNGAISSLNRTKATLLFNGLYSQLVEIPANINIESNSLTFNENKLDKAILTTYPYNSVETIQYENYYTQTIYEANLTISEVGTANAKNELKPEAEKTECIPLQEALDKLANSRNYRVRRHYKATDNGEPVEQEEAIDVYFDGAKKAVYQSVYQWQEGAPTGITAADGFYIDSPKDDDELLNAYMYQPFSDGTNKFLKSPELGAIDNVLSYEQFSLTEIGNIDANTFNRNDDGSYSPIPSNLATIASDCFVPFTATTSEISGGFVDDFKLYLNEDTSSDLLFRIELNCSIGNIESLITIYFDQIGTAKIPFGALDQIVY